MTTNNALGIFSLLNIPPNSILGNPSEVTAAVVATSLNSNVIYVSSTGSNTNKGTSSVYPFQTLDHAYSQITDASETNIYVIELDPSSSYTCSAFKPNIILKANGSKIITNLNIINFNDQNSYYVIQDAKIQFTSSPTLIDFSSKTSGVNTFLTFKNIEFLNGQNITITGSDGPSGVENVFFYNSFLVEAGTPNFTFNNIGWVYLEGNYVGTNVYNNSSAGERSVFLYSNYFDSAPVFKTTSAGIINGRVEGNTVLSAITFDGAAIQGSGIKIGNSQIVAQPILLNGATYAPRGISEAIKVLLNPLNYTRNASAAGFSLDSAESNFRGIDSGLGLRLLASDKAIASDINTGTNDTKYITALALQNSRYFQPVTVSVNRTVSTTTYGAGTPVLNTIVSDTLSTYNVANGVFTAPSSGVYETSYCLHFTVTSNANNQFARIDTTGYKNGILSIDLYTRDVAQLSSSGQEAAFTVTNVFSFPLLQGQTISVSAANNGTAGVMTLTSGFMTIKKISD